MTVPIQFDHQKDAVTKTDFMKLDNTGFHTRKKHVQIFEFFSGACLIFLGWLVGKVSWSQIYEKQQINLEWL